MRREQLYTVGETITFEGYADDYDKAIRAIQFSLDNGKTWTEYATTGAHAGCWVYWHFAYEAERPGRYLLRVRSVNEDGKVSPTDASIEFSVA